METHSGDTPINRFFSFWGAILTFASFGILVLLLVVFEATLLSNAKPNVDDVRRTELDIASLAAQSVLANTWKKNDDDGTIEVPASVALSFMTNKLSKAQKSVVPVPGTMAAEVAAAAMAAAAEAAKPEADAAPAQK